MKLKYLPGLLLALMYSSLNAQIPLSYLEIDEGKVREKERWSRITDIIAEREGKTYALFQEFDDENEPLDKYALHRYGEDFQLEKAQPLEMKWNKKKRQYQYATFSDGKLLLFTSQIDRKARKYNLYSQEVNIETLMLSEEAKLVTDVPYIPFVEGQDDPFSFYYSSDSSKFLISGRIPQELEPYGTVKTGVDPYKFTVFTRSMAPIWKKEIHLAIPNRKFSAQNIIVDNMANLHVLGISLDNRDQVGKEPIHVYYHSLFTFSNFEQKLFGYDIDGQGVFLQDLTLFRNSRNEVVVTGFFAAEFQKEVAGTYYAQIDEQEHSLKNVALRRFPEGFIPEFKDDRSNINMLDESVALQRLGAPRFRLRSTFVKKDGGAVLVAEQMYGRDYQYGTHNAGYSGLLSVNTVTGSRVYHYNDVIMVNLDVDGKLLWVERIPKQQETTDDLGAYSSFFALSAHGNMYLIFNDHPANGSNIDDESGEPFKERGEGILTITEITQLGMKSKRALTSPGNYDLTFLPRMFHRTPSGNVITYSVEEYKEQLGVIRF